MENKKVTATQERKIWGTEAEREGGGEEVRREGRRGLGFFRSGDGVGSIF